MNRLMDLLHSLLVHELADLRRQFDDTRRLASETQARFRLAEEVARSFMADGPLETYRRLQAEHDQLLAERELAIHLAVHKAIAECGNMHRQTIEKLRARAAALEALRDLYAVRLRNWDLALGRGPIVNEPIENEPLIDACSKWAERHGEWT